MLQSSSRSKRSVKPVQRGRPATLTSSSSQTTSVSANSASAASLSPALVLTPLPDAESLDVFADFAAVPDSEEEEENEVSNPEDFERNAGKEAKEEENDKSYVDTKPSDAAKKAKAEEKQRLKAIEACQRLLQSLSTNTGFGAKERKALKALNDFAQTTTSLGFSDVKTEHLEALGYRRGEIKFNRARLRERAFTRRISPRFTETQEHLKNFGVSHKERMSEYIAVDHIVESMANPGENFKTQRDLLTPKFSPQLTFPASAHACKDGNYEFHGVVDVVSYMVDDDSNLVAQDLMNLGMIACSAQVSHRNLVSMELKCFGGGFLPDHISEGVAQAMNASALLENDPQKFVLSDGYKWRFCVLEVEDKTYYVSDEVGPASEDILVALDSWIWEDAADSNNGGLWDYVRKTAPRENL